jgi:D-sedoheptulose 7-phosphate isomerase
MDYTSEYFNELKQIVTQLNQEDVNKIIDLIVTIRENKGRIFFIGVGGGAGNSTHAVNDFRKIAGIESYTPTDNISELSARINDDGWDSVFKEYLKGSKLTHNDLVFVFSVGGGNQEKNISTNIIKALDYAQEIGAKITGIVGRDGGYTAKVADACVIIPTVNPTTVTPHVESFQAIIWHLIVSHPKIGIHEMKWESVDKARKQ